MVKHRKMDICHHVHVYSKRRTVQIEIHPCIQSFERSFIPGIIVFKITISASLWNFNVSAIQNLKKMYLENGSKKRSNFLLLISLWKKMWWKVGHFWVHSFYHYQASKKYCKSASGGTSTILLTCWIHDIQNIHNERRK